MGNGNDEIAAAEMVERVALALEDVAQAFREGRDLSIAEMRGGGSENYFLGLVQMQEQVARAQYETARVAAQANTIAIMAAMGISFDAKGGLSEADEDALINAQNRVKEMATQLQPAVYVYGQES